MKSIVLVLCAISLVTLCSAKLTSSSSTAVETLPAIGPLLNLLLPSINTIYNLVLAFLSALDNLPAEICATLPLDLGTIKSALLKLYLQVLELAQFLVDLPRDDGTKRADASNSGIQEKCQAYLDIVGKLDLSGVAVPLLGGVFELSVVVIKTVLDLLI